jgi:hypothetical protein
MLWLALHQVGEEAVEEEELSNGGNTSMCLGWRKQGLMLRKLKRSGWIKILAKILVK